MATHSETSASILALTPQELRDQNLFERGEALQNIGMLADENRIGHPERPYEEWTPNDFKAVVAIFRSWPRDAALEQQLSDLRKNFVRLFNDGIQQNHGLNRKEKMLLAADCLSAAGVNVFGADFPKVELDFMPGPTKGYYGGLRPDNKIQINSANLSRDKVRGSEFSGDASFIELVAHESTHLIQRHLSETSDGETPDARLSMRVAEAFYESTAGAKEFNRDLYWQHPFETQAREYAHELVVALGDSANASFEASDRPPLRSTGIRPAFAKG